MTGLLADAELREYILEDVVGGDFAGDLTEVVDRGADILAQQFRRESMLQSVQSRIQRRERLAQGVVVALVGEEIAGGTEIPKGTSTLILHSRARRMAAMASES